MPGFRGAVLNSGNELKMCMIDTVLPLSVGNCLRVMVDYLLKQHTVVWLPAGCLNHAPPVPNTVHYVPNFIVWYRQCVLGIASKQPDRSVSQASGQLAHVYKGLAVRAAATRLPYIF